MQLRVAGQRLRLVRVHLYHRRLVKLMQVVELLQLDLMIGRLLMLLLTLVRRRSAHHSRLTQPVSQPSARIRRSRIRQRSLSQRRAR